MTNEERRRRKRELKAKKREREKMLERARIYSDRLREAEEIGDVEEVEKIKRMIENPETDSKYTFWVIVLTPLILVGIYYYYMILLFIALTPVVLGFFCGMFKGLMKEQKRR